MMKRITVYILAFLIIVFTGALYAQEMTEEPAYISYIVGTVDVDITPENGIEDFIPAELDMDLPPGTVIKTGDDGLCEITMPDESTIKISSSSSFKIETVQMDRQTGRKKQRFSLAFGRVRAKVKKLTTSDSEFSIVSGTALAGVRGTSFGVKFDGIKAQILVFEGQVTLSSITGLFEPVTLNEGFMGVVAEGGLPEPVVPIPEDVLKEWEEEAKKFIKEEKPAEEAKPTEEAAPPKEVKKPEEKKPKKESFIEKFLRMNAYVGTITIGDRVYSRWVFTPELNFGKLGMGLYLPAVFSPDVGIFGFKDWENHDEWDFRDWKDGLHDFVTKFYYVSWGTFGDPVYFKIGSIDNFFLGHGFIVDNYSNMVYFPEEVTVGMQLNIDAGAAGFETMVADFSRLQLFGGRFFIRPAGKSFPLAIGVTGIHDKPEPATINGNPTETDQLPRLIFTGADLDLPILRLKVFSMKLYADAAKIGYIYKEVPSTLSGYVDPGTFNFLNGLGTGMGLMGTIAKVFNYRVEYRYILGYYEPGIINYLWENRRLEYPAEMEELITNEDSYKDATQAGFLIKGSMVLFKKLEFGLGYENFDKTTGTQTETVRKGTMFVNVEKDLIPKVYGNLSYDRTDNLEDIFKHPFNEDTVLNAEIYYELGAGISLVVNYKRTFKYNDETDEYDPIDSFGMNTVFTFF